jgi:hypothetical protein
MGDGLGHSPFRRKSAGGVAFVLPGQVDHPTDEDLSVGTPVNALT